MAELCLLTFEAKYSCGEHNVHNLFLLFCWDESCSASSLHRCAVSQPVERFGTVPGLAPGFLKLNDLYLSQELQMQSK